ncbi:MAG: DUF4203 domain-containing protein [candidate division WOR-3 bacterium]
MSFTDVAGGVLAMVLGMLVCFLGYRLIRVTLGIAGFLVGAAIVCWLVSMITGVAPLFVVIAALVGGIIGTVLAVLLYKAGVFLLGAAAGALVAGFVTVGTGHTPTSLVLIAAGIVAGVVTVLLERPLVSVLTAFGGALAAVAGLFQLCGWFRIVDGYKGLAGLRAAGALYWLALGSWVVLGVLGTVVQLKHKKK